MTPKALVVATTKRTHRVSMARRSVLGHLITTAVLLLLPLLTLAAGVQAGQGPRAETFHLHVPAVAEWISSTCPWGEEWFPGVDTRCVDYYVLYFREGEPSQLRHEPWRLYVVLSDWMVHPDGTATFLNETWGLLESPQGSFDEKKYTFAGVSGSVPMSDGSQLAVDLTWDMRLAELHHGGNNSAFNPANGIDRHYNDRCTTIIQNAHQQWRRGTPAMISGSIGGVAVDSLYTRPDEPFIAGRSHFIYVTVEHGDCPDL
jgi:hypothetical protein